MISIDQNMIFRKTSLINIYSMKNKDELVYNLIFSDNVQFIIDIGEYITDIYKYDDFVDEIKQILHKSKVVLVSNSIDVDSKTVIWKLKVKK
jgi:hypothetical protein